MSAAQNVDYPLASDKSLSLSLNQRSRVRLVRTLPAPAGPMIMAPNLLMLGDWMIRPLGYLCVWVSR